MLCEPIFSLPQRVDLQTLQKSDQPYFAAHDHELKAEKGKQLLPQTAAPYDILPMSFNNRNEHLKNVLSLRENDYLSCKWNAFLDNETSNYYPKIRLYTDVRKIPIKPRKFSLNGQFYVNNKLSPIPILEDPRFLDKALKFNKCQRLTQLADKK